MSSAELSKNLAMNASNAKSMPASSKLIQVGVSNYSTNKSTVGSIGVAGSSNLGGQNSPAQIGRSKKASMMLLNASSYEQDRYMERIMQKDLDSKAVVIQRLMQEANEHASNLAKHAELISSLRTSNKAIESEIEALQTSVKNTRKMGSTRIEDMRKRQQEAIIAVKAAQSKEAKMLEQIKGLSAAIVEEQLKQKEALKNAAKLKREVEEYSVRPGRRHWAEKSGRAIDVQQQFIERLKKENASIPGMAERARRNERVIAKLEKKLYSCSQEAIMVEGDEKINPRTKYRIRDLQQQIMDAKDRHTALEKVLNGETSTESAPASEEGAAGTGSEAKDARIKALEEQLVQNAKEFAAQISKLKLDIMNAEMGGGDDDDDDDDDDDNDDNDNDASRGESSDSD